jgi:hypothetical protein
MTLVGYLKKQSQFVACPNHLNPFGIPLGTPYGGGCHTAITGLMKIEFKEKYL